MARFRRRQFVVLVPFQARLVAFQLLLLVAFTLLLWVLVFYPLQLETAMDLGTGGGGLPGPIPPFPSARVLIGLAIALVTMVALTLSESLLIAGPVYRLEQTMRVLVEGNVPQRVTLRKGDHFRQLEPLINELAGRFEAAANAVRCLQGSLAPGLDELAALCSQGGASEPVRARVEALRVQVRQVMGGPA